MQQQINNLTKRIELAFEYFQLVDEPFEIFEYTMISNTKKVSKKQLLELKEKINQGPDAFQKQAETYYKRSSQEIYNIAVKFLELHSSKQLNEYIHKGINCRKEFYDIQYKKANLNVYLALMAFTFFRYGDAKQTAQMYYVKQKENETDFCNILDEYLICIEKMKSDISNI